MPSLRRTSAVLSVALSILLVSVVALVGSSVRPARAAEPPRIVDVDVPVSVGAGGELVLSWRVVSEVGIGTYGEFDGPRPSTWVKIGGTNGWIGWCGFPLTTRMVGGTENDGSYTTSCRIPEAVPNGSYTAFLAAVDRSGVYAVEQQVSFQVAGGSPDGAAPIVSEVTVDSPAVPGEGLVVRWRAIDESGVAYVVPWAFGPNGRVVDDAGRPWLGYAEGVLVAGTARDGRWSATLPLAASAEPGTYTVWFSVGDVVGNREATTSPAGPGSVYATFAVGGSGVASGPGAGTTDSTSSTGAGTDDGTGAASPSTPGEGGVTIGPGGGPGVGPGMGPDVGTDGRETGSDPTGDLSGLTFLAAATRAAGAPGAILVAMALVGLAILLGPGLARRRRRRAD